MGRQVIMLLKSIDEAFSSRSWHGTNLLGSLRGVKSEEAAWRPGEGRHNAWEIAVHAAYWKYAVYRRLTGASRGSFPYKGSDWFFRPDGKAQWIDDIQILRQQHARLREAISRLRERDLACHPEGQVNAEALIRGVAAHDLYHAGQIQLLKRLYRSR